MYQRLENGLIDPYDVYSWKVNPGWGLDTYHFHMDKDGAEKVNKFKKVFAIIAKELDVEVQCLGIKGAFEAYSRYMKFPKPRKIEVKVLEKFSPEGTYEEIAAKAENIIREYVEN